MILIIMTLYLNDILYAYCVDLPVDIYTGILFAVIDFDRNDWLSQTSQDVLPKGV